MRSFKLTLAYDGTAYAGWQVQPDRPTIQEALELALQEITNEQIRCTASGRTDAGVHALAQVVSFTSETALPVDVLRKAIDANLPADIAVHEVVEAPEGFHAIRHAVRKRYRYLIQDGPVADVFARRFVWHMHQQLDDHAMQRAAVALLGTHDFASFEAAGAERPTSVRTVTDISVVRSGEGIESRIIIEIEADGFLYNMVRIIVGTLVEVGKGKRDENCIANILSAKNRAAAGMTAPPQGLFLVSVDYP